MPTLRDRYEALRPEVRERLPAMALALAVEGLLVLILLSLGSVRREIAEMSETLVAFTSPARDATMEEVAAPAEAAEELEEAATPPRLPVMPAEPEPQPVTDAEPAPAGQRQLAPPILIPRPMRRSTFSLENAPRGSEGSAPPPQVFGPAFAPALGDTPRIPGGGPNGEPLYAARWYREPYPEELAGYLSTASGPGVGIIDCRTVPDFRVEDCVIVGEAPEGSGIAEAAQAAAWQFKVRPPQRGGRPLVGEWVRIRIEYTINRVRTPEERYGN